MSIPFQEPIGIIKDLVVREMQCTKFGLKEVRMNKVVIVAAKRTPIGSFMGGLSTVPATVLGSKVISAALDELKLNPSIVDEVFMQNPFLLKIL